MNKIILKISNYREERTDNMDGEIIELINKYIDYPKDKVEELISSSSRVEYASAGTGYLEGYYCPSRIELFVSGCKRGRLIKRPGKNFNGYKYFFSADNEICLIDTFSSRELLIREGDHVYGIYYHKFWESEIYDLSYITEAIYESNLIRSYTEYGVTLYDLNKPLNKKENMRIYTDYQEYIYSDEAVPSIEKIILEYRDYNIFDRVDKVISSEEINPVRDNDSENYTEAKIDNQKKLAGKLKRKINNISSLDQAVKAFFEAVSEASPNDEEMLLYEVGCYPVDENSNACMFCLTRQTPSEDGEFYQMYLVLQYEIDDRIESLNECVWHEKGDDDLYEYVLQSEAYQTLKERSYIKISVGVDET